MVPFLLLTALVYSPYVVYLWSTYWALPRTPTTLGQAWIEAVLGFVLCGMATGAVSYGVFHQLGGRPASVGRSIVEGMRRFLPVLGVSLVAGTLTTLGFFLLLVPGFIVSCMLAVAIPVAIVERKGVLGSLRRSIALTHGHKGTIFWVYFSIELAATVVAILVSLRLTEAEPMSAFEERFDMLVAAFAVVSGALLAVANSVIYHDLRVTRESATSEELIAVFD